MNTYLIMKIIGMMIIKMIMAKLFRDCRLILKIELIAEINQLGF